MPRPLDAIHISRPTWLTLIEGANGGIKPQFRLQHGRKLLNVLVKLRLIQLKSNFTNVHAYYIASNYPLNLRFTGWLEPLLARIVEDERHVVLPMHDIIDKDTFKYIPYVNDNTPLSVFNWYMFFTWRHVQLPINENRKSIIDPIR